MTQSNGSKRCVIYSRVSSEEQLKGLSVDVQKENCAKWAKENDYQIVGVFEDGGKTGTKTVGRDGLEDMIIQCQEDHIEAALVVDTDRIARNEVDHFFIKNELKKGSTQLIAINQPMINDSPEGQFFETILAGTNAFYSRLLGRKVKKSLEKKCQMGDFPGWGPLGYLNVNKGTEEKPHKVIEVDPEKGPFITELFHLYSTGNFSVDSLVDIMYGKGLRSKNNKRVYRSVMYNIIKNPFYIGMFRYNGEIIKGNHVPLTTTEIFGTCQKITQLHNQNACRRRKYRWLLNGFAYCNTCGSRMYAEWHYKKQKAYYHCNKKNHCKEPYVEMYRLEKIIEEEFKKIQFSKVFTQRVVDKSKELVKKSRENMQEEIQGLRNAVIQLENKRNLLEDALLDQTIDKESFKRKHTDLEMQITSLQQQISDIETNNRIDIDVVSEIMDLASNIYETYKKSNFDAKRLYQSIFFETFKIKGRKVIEAKPTPLFASLIEADYCRVAPNLLPR